jgi:hypothetical protein
MWFDDKHIQKMHDLLSWPNFKSLRDGYADYNPSVWKNYYIYIYLKTPLFQLMLLVIFSGLNFYTYQIWNSEFFLIFLGFIVVSIIFTAISLTTTSFTIPDTVVFPLFTIIVISFIYQGSTFPLIYVMYTFYTIKLLHNNGLIKFRKPKSNVLKIIGNQAATVEYHYTKNCWILAVFNTYSKYLFVMCYAYSYYSSVF